VLIKDKNQEIIEAIKNGSDSKVLNLLYKTSLPQIVKYISQNNGDSSEAKDIFQDAVITLFRHVKLGKFDETKEVNAFLYAISRNMWINRVKKRNKQFDISDVQLENIQESPFTVVVAKDKEDLIDELMTNIGENCKQILKYVIYDSYNMKEIAKLMNFTGENVAKSTHYRCKQKLMEFVSGNQTLINYLRNELK
jgi:RNA polymerase sigma factor (sigma-70 family)